MFVLGFKRLDALRYLRVGKTWVGWYLEEVGLPGTCTAVPWREGVSASEHMGNKSIISCEPHAAAQHARLKSDFLLGTPFFCLLLSPPYNHPDF